VLATSQQHQLMSDRSALVTRADAVPQLQQAADRGTSGLYGFYLQLQGQATGQAYSNVFLICAWLSVLGLGLAFMMKKPAQDEAAQPVAPEAAPAGTELTPARGAPATSPAEAGPDSGTGPDAGSGTGADAGSDTTAPGGPARELAGGPARSGGR